MERLKSSAFTERERNCTFSLVLDKRTNRKDIITFPLAIRFTIERKSMYYPIGNSYTERDFSEISTVGKGKSPKYATQQEWRQIMLKYKKLIVGLNKGHQLSLDLIKTALSGKSTDENISFTGIWKEIIKTLSETGRYTTAESYECALKSFEKILWKAPVEGFHIDKEVLEKWNQGMMNGVKNAKGVKVGKISDTTRGIYLRTARVVWNECIKRGYLLNNEYPFSNKRDNNLISIPKGGTRKADFLDVDKMTVLYRTFVEKNYSESWPSDFTANVNYSLGLFLVQYLCNGFNLADEAELIYDDYYYSTNGNAFRFRRKKTAGRSEDGAEVIIPIIDPLRRVLDEIAASPRKGALVFPQILKGAKTDREKRKRTTQENQNIRKRLQILCKDVLGWEEKISGTWARHSFATNLRNAGVDMQYISESMGHSTHKSVTALYLSSYPLDKQFEYNNRLLRLREEPSVKDIKKMTKEEMQALLIKMMSQG